MLHLFMPIVKNILISFLIMAVVHSKTVVNIAKVDMNNKHFSSFSAPGIYFLETYFYHSNFNVAIFRNISTASSRLTYRGMQQIIFLSLSLKLQHSHHTCILGGYVNANTQVIQVLWGKGNYDPSVTSTSTPSMATFYQQVLSNGALTSWRKLS